MKKNSHAVGEKLQIAVLMATVLAVIVLLLQLVRFAGFLVNKW